MWEIISTLNYEALLAWSKVKDIVLGKSIKTNKAKFDLL